MRGVVRKLGSSAWVRIPRSVLQSARLKVGDLIEIREEAGRIVIEPTRPNDYEFEVLVRGINRKNLHHEVSLGDPVGDEFS